MTTYLPHLPLRKERLQKMHHLIAHVQYLASLTPSDEAIPQLLHWDIHSESLQNWLWPCYPDGKAVPPDELQQYFLGYTCRPPCCLCAYCSDFGIYNESKVSLVETVNPRQKGRGRLPLIGQYVAECATGACGYFVNLDIYYPKKALLLKQYPQRYEEIRDPYDLKFFDDDMSLAEIMAEGEKEETAGFRRVFAAPSQESGDFSRGNNSLKRLRQDCKADILDDIDEIGDLFQKGLPPSKFWELFIECAQCGYVLPRYLYPYSHHCKKRKHVAGGWSRTPAEPSTSKRIRTAEVDECDLVTLAGDAEEEDAQEESLPNGEEELASTSCRDSEGLS